MTIADAVYALGEQAAGREPNRARLLAGALALSKAVAHGIADRDVLDAAAGLELVATGRSFTLDEIGRRRAAALAETVRALGEAFNK
jgi:hypothetical protein